MRNVPLSTAFLLGSLTMLQAQAPRVRPQPGYEVHADRTVTFKLNAPEATSVSVSGDFTGDAIPMTKDDDGAWTGTAGPLRPAIYNYRFSVNGVAVVDPANPWIGTADRGSGSAMFEVTADSPSPYDPQDVPHGALHVHYYKSEKFGGALRMVYVYTPPGYDNSGESYPSLYLLHGAGGNEASWFTAGRANLILDNLIASGSTKPMIVVMPYGRASQSTTLGLTPPAQADPSGVVFPNDVVEDVIPFVESLYRIKSDAGNRAIAGLSMGGNQTLMIGLANIDKFHSIGAFSPVIFNQSVEQDHAAAFADVAATNRNLKLFRIYIGDADPLFESNVSFHELLEKKGVEHVFTVGKEGHVWRNWRDYLADFAPRLFQ